VGLKRERGAATPRPFFFPPLPAGFAFSARWGDGPSAPPVLGPLAPQSGERAGGEGRGCACFARRGEAAKWRRGERRPRTLLSHRPASGLNQSEAPAGKSQITNLKSQGNLKSQISTPQGVARVPWESVRTTTTFQMKDELKSQSLSGWNPLQRKSAAFSVLLRHGNRAPGETGRGPRRRGTPARHRRAAASASAWGLASRGRRR
jgi:hypothetical protein